MFDLKKKRKESLFSHDNNLATCFQTTIFILLLAWDKLGKRNLMMLNESHTCSEKTVLQGDPFSEDVVHHYMLLNSMIGAITVSSVKSLGSIEASCKQ